MNMRYARSRLSEKEMEQNCEKIQSFLRHSDDYKNPNLCIWDISLATEIAPAAISQSLNRFLNLNFFDVVNRKRLEEVKRILLSDNTNSYTIESVAYDCGFRSRSTFYAAFNKLEGTSPAKWLKTALETDKANEKTPPG
ncbi:helix-turn-helix domain-containing protein [Parabacteroides chinchillae]|uniref:AraC-type DNA-binding protein n=1 Tax=Parabacteroides chinchillae TaxID=871327 RepID=A0A8G2BYC9_9BACT|nr:helix-turn-helix domain-containing protein [Parabacteroides chinchillae]SEG17857.1 AraC-type DNA-binding protein [Parabacteroides chinchillae]